MTQSGYSRNVNMFTILCLQEIVRLLKHMEKSSILAMDQGRYNVCIAINQDIRHGCEVAKMLCKGRQNNAANIFESARFRTAQCCMSLVSILVLHT